jgi:hypothetical protein
LARILASYNSADAVLMNKELDPRGRYDAVMAAEGLFQVEPVQQTPSSRETWILSHSERCNGLAHVSGIWDRPLDLGHDDNLPQTEGFN